MGIENKGQTHSTQSPLISGQHSYDCLEGISHLLPCYKNNNQAKSLMAALVSRPSVGNQRTWFQFTCHREGVVLVP